MRIPFLIPLFVLSTSAFESFDFVEDAVLKYVNHNADPCDDFYRHTCPLSLPFENLLAHSYQKLFTYFRGLQQDAFWNYFSFMEDRQQMNADELPENVNDFLTGVALEICVTQRDELPLYFEINGVDNVDLVAPNCANIFEIFVDNSENSEDVTSTKMSLDTINDDLDEGIAELEAINGIIDEDVTRGIKNTEDLIHQMASLANKWIQKTPWTANNNVTGMITEIVSGYKLLGDFPKHLVNTSRELMSFQKNYEECKMKFHNISNRNIACYISAYGSMNSLPRAFQLEYNAFNSNSSLTFSYPIYHHNQHAREIASRLGFVGYTIGHELSHSLVKDYRPFLQPPFSKIAEKCVQNQFKATCKEFKEKSCQVEDLHLGENSADILGLQLAYQMLSDHYGTKLNEKIERLGVTYEQLFFYAAAFGDCNTPLQETATNKYGELDEHSASNIRVNVFAQHPGFRKAFNCSCDSRMMRSATKQCIIYGERAPQTRKTMSTCN